MRTESALNVRYKKQVHFFSFLLFEFKKKSLCRLEKYYLMMRAQLSVTINEL